MNKMTCSKVRFPNRVKMHAVLRRWEVIIDPHPCPGFEHVQEAHSQLHHHRTDSNRLQARFWKLIHSLLGLDHLTLLSKASTRVLKAATMSRIRLILSNSVSSSSICLSRPWTRAISALAASIEEIALELCLCTDACVSRVNSMTQLCQ